MINLDGLQEKLSSNVLSFEEQQALKGKGRCRGRNRCGGKRRRRRRNGGGGCSSSTPPEETSTPIKDELGGSTSEIGGSFDLG